MENYRQRSLEIQPLEIQPPDPTKIGDPKHWIDRAKEARSMAELMAATEPRIAMIGVALQYERLAHWALARALDEQARQALRQAGRQG